MKRRSFLSLIGAAGLAPALPSVATPASSGVTISAYARALAHVRTRTTVSAKGLAHCLQLSLEQADALLARLTSKGVIRPISGSTRAVSTIGDANMWGLENASNRTVAANVKASQANIKQQTTETGKPTVRTNTMEKFEKLSGIAAPMPLVNIDTDMIIPKVFLKTIKRSGLGVNLFDEMRYDREGNEIEDFVLNKPAYREAQILVAGDNFGCGSSREHAPWALADFGIKAVISTSFADIFYNNCFKNGILPIVLPQEAVDVLMQDAEKGANARMEVDLENQTVTTSDGESFSFEVDSFKKHCLLEGLDDIGLTMEKAASIDTFEAKASAARPWV